LVFSDEFVENICGILVQIPQNLRRLAQQNGLLYGDVHTTAKILYFHPYLYASCTN
jgi:hypothetical protein